MLSQDFIAVEITSSYICASVAAPKLFITIYSIICDVCFAHRKYTV